MAIVQEKGNASIVGTDRMIKQSNYDSLPSDGSNSANLISQ